MQHRRLALALMALFVCASVFAPLVVSADTLPTFGWIERVRISPGDIELNAKLDSGADHTSLHAKDFELFKRRGRDYVRFTIRNRAGKEATIERRINRVASIKRGKGKRVERPVIKLYICLGDRFMRVDVNLADRSDFAYPMLIGRSFLAGNGLIDSSKTYTQAPSCTPLRDAGE
jgi:hypothetical protein